MLSRSNRDTNGDPVYQDIRQDDDGTWSRNVWWGSGMCVTNIRRLSGYRTRAAARDGSIGEPVWETNARHEARLKRPPKEEGDET